MKKKKLFSDFGKFFHFLLQHSYKKNIILIMNYLSLFYLLENVGACWRMLECWSVGEGFLFGKCKKYFFL